MAMTTTDNLIDKLIADEGDDVSLVKPEVGALEAITRSEVSMQLEAAHRYPRSISRFLREAKDLCTRSVDVAEACFYSVPRDGKTISGPSVRLAEICSSTWGNLHIGARVIDEMERAIVAQGVCWDLQTNLRVTVEVQRPILTKNGKRFGDAMIATTGLAATSIALRNAVFRVIPRTYVNALYEAARATAVGDAKTFVSRRDEVLARMQKMGLTQERIFNRLEVLGVSDLTGEHLATLIGLGTAIRQNEISIDEAFPALAPVPVPEGTPEGKRVKLPGKRVQSDASNDTGES